MEPVNFEGSKHVPLLPKLDYGTKYGLLGVGGYGEVHHYRRHDLKEFAIKVAGTQQGQSVRETLKEAIIIKRLCHPNIVDIIDIIPTEHRIELVFPMARGDLTVVFANKTYSEASRFHIMYQVVCAVAYIHSRDIVHGDIKPNNILLYDTDDVRLSDFGACHQSNYTYPRTPYNCGTLWFRAPELLLDETLPYSKESEMWAVACTLWWIYTGDHLFKSHSELDALFEIFRVLGTPDTVNRSYARWKEDRKKINERVQYAQFNTLLNNILVYNDDKNNRPDAQTVLSNTIFDRFRSRLNEHQMDAPGHRYIIPLLWPKNMSKCRFITVEWLAIVSYDFLLKIRTYLGCVVLFDLVVPKLDKNINMQLVGVACMSLICDIWESSEVELGEFEYITDHSCKVSAIREMRTTILRVLNYDLCYTLPCDYPVHTYEQKIIVLARACMIFFYLDSEYINHTPKNIHNMTLVAAQTYYDIGSDIQYDNKVLQNLLKKHCANNDQWGLYFKWVGNVDLQQFMERLH
jgi:serine/threonine protein kinase